MEQKKETRKFIGLPVSDDEFKAIEGLLIAAINAKNEPLKKTDMFRDAIDMLAREVQGKPIFNA